jgi:hypothetical protein
MSGLFPTAHKRRGPTVLRDCADQQVQLVFRNQLNLGRKVVRGAEFELVALPRYLLSPHERLKIGVPAEDAADIDAIARVGDDTGEIGP